MAAGKSAKTRPSSSAPHAGKPPLREYPAAPTPKETSSSTSRRTSNTTTAETSSAFPSPLTGRQAARTPTLRVVVGMAGARSSSSPRTKRSIPAKWKRRSAPGTVTSWMKIICRVSSAERGAKATGESRWELVATLIPRRGGRCNHVKREMTYRTGTKSTKC